jgi:hypothetical protein
LLKPWSSTSRERSGEFSIIDILSGCKLSFPREQQHAVQRYEQWQKLREMAKGNANGKLPDSFDEQEPTPPPPPVAEDEILDLTMDFNAISMDPETELDESGVERVPMADPEMDVSLLSWFSTAMIDRAVPPATVP